MLTRLLAAAGLSLLVFACGAETSSDDEAEVPVGELSGEENEIVKRSVVIDADDDGKTVSVAPDQKFSIKLTQNSASSGYRWHLKKDGGFGMPDLRTVAPPSGRIGGTGTDYFSWNAGDNTGKHVIELAYARGENGTPAKKFSVTIDVKSTAGAGKCGGLAGLRCSGSEWCDYTGSVCGRFDQMGTCAPRPERCAMVYKPVCGCNGQTFSNACMAKAKGVDTASEGACSN